MEKILNLTGSIVAIVTPFNEDSSIDYDAYRNLLDFHLASGTQGIVVCGTTGETPTLTQAEYKEIISYTVKHIAGKIPVIAGAGTNSTNSTISNCKLCEEMGVDGLLVVGPYYNKPTQAGFYSHFKAVAENTSLPIILYNVPGRTAKNIDNETTIKLANNFQNIVATKEASGDLEQIMDLIDRKPNSFKIYSGDDSLALAITLLGGAGCISVIANEMPKEFSEMLKLALNGEVKEAKNLHYKMLNLMGLNFIESNPAPVKAALAKMGKIKETLRPPLVQMEPHNKEILFQELKKLDL